MTNCLPKSNLDSPIRVNSIIVTKKTPMKEAEVFDTILAQVFLYRA